MVKRLRAVTVQAHRRPGSRAAAGAGRAAEDSGRRQSGGRHARGHAEGLWPPPEVVLVEAGGGIVRIVVVAVAGWRGKTGTRSVSGFGKIRILDFSIDSSFSGKNVDLGRERRMSPFICRAHMGSGGTN